MMITKLKYSLFILYSALISCNNKKKSVNPEDSLLKNSISNISYSIIKSYPHDTTSFTEGFLFHEGRLFESTGSPEELMQTRSIIGVVNLTTGKIVKKIEIDRNKYFGEGIVFLAGKLFQLTYRNKVAFIYDSKTYKRIGQANLFVDEGWGMTTDSISILMSDGTDKIYFIDPNSFKQLKLIKVTENGTPINKINEMEYVNGYIYANIFTTNIILKIDAKNGFVVGKLDLTNLHRQVENEYGKCLEMNGIAFNPKTKTFFITGKLWPRIFEIQISQ